MSVTTTSRKNMTDDQVWQSIVDDCRSSQTSISCGSALRRKAILEMDRRLKEQGKPNGMKTESSIRKALEQTQKQVILVDGVPGNVPLVPTTLIIDYLVAWVNICVFGSAEYKGKDLFYCTTHHKSYLQDVSLGRLGLGCSICKDK